MDTNLLVPWMVLQMTETNTGGGGYIGNDANTRNFTGRDDLGNRVEINLDRNRDGGYQPPHPMSILARLEAAEDDIKTLKQDVYGSAQSGIAGVIRNQIKQLHLSQANMALNTLTLIAFAIYVIINWGG